MGWVVNATPRLYPRERPGTHFIRPGTHFIRPGTHFIRPCTHCTYKRLGEPQSQSGQVGEISPPPGFDTRTVQPVTIRYTDWDNPAPSIVTVLSTTLVGMLPNLLLT
jgi:hypothetical protein